MWVLDNVWVLRLTGQAGGERLTVVEEPRPLAPQKPRPDVVMEAETVTGEGPTLSPRPHRRVLFSSTLDTLYSMFLPIATEAWNACGWQPTALLIGAAHEWAERAEFLLARRFGLDVIFIPRIEGFADSTVAQVGRLFPHQLLGGRWPVADGDYVMTGDVDMIPLSATHWATPGDGVTVWYGNAYPAEPPRYPLCNLGATCAVWKEVMGKETLEGCLRGGLGANADAKTAWNYDELLAGRRIRSWSGFPGRLHVVSREGAAPLRDRADRVAWPTKIRPGLVDAHLPRPAGPHAELIRDLLRVYYPEMLSWFPDYLKGGV
jgi:hypothetical protein